MAIFNATLTLPGIAGFILTIGAAVDANVLINERIREEIRRGRRLIDAVETGYQRSDRGRFSTPTSPTSSRPRSWPISARARCAASPSC